MTKEDTVFWRYGESDKPLVETSTARSKFFRELERFHKLVERFDSLQCYSSEERYCHKKNAIEAARALVGKKVLLAIRECDEWVVTYGLEAWAKEDV